MKTIISRLTMRPVCRLFEDAVGKKTVYLYEDKYGLEWMANYPFYFWSDRTRRYEIKNDIFKESPIHDKKAIISMMDELEPKEMIEVVEFIKSKQLETQTPIQEPIEKTAKDKLFDLANEFAVLGNGKTAVRLHSIYNGLH